MPTTVRYDDPYYAELARAAEARHNLPTGILDAIRTRGERSNADQVSPAGAKTVYQFIPATRRGMIKNYGVDPWKRPEDATEAAALLLLENKGRSGSWDKAVTQYHGGLDPRNYGPRTHAYAKRVGDFDGASEMASNGYYPGAPGFFPPNSVRGYTPIPDSGAVPLNLPPEPLKEAVPVMADGPSVSIPAASPAAAKHRGGLLGALESVFMPDPSSRWAGALRDGVFNARESQDAYKSKKEADQLAIDTANAKLKHLLTQGEFQVVGNNVFHIRPDGSHEIITPPATPSENERLIDKWSQMDDNDPAKALIHQLLLKGNDPETLAAKQQNALAVARVRAGATTGAATIRANSANSKTPPIPDGWSVVK